MFHFSLIHLLLHSDQIFLSFRSFPRCSWLGHVSCKRDRTDGVYSKCRTCGTEVTILFEVNFKSIGGGKADLLVLGEIVKEGDPSSYQQQSIVQQKDINERIVLADNKESVQRTIHRAKIVEVPQDSDQSCESHKFRCSIFPPKGGFKYAWRSSRWTCETKHTFEWTVLQKTQNGDYKVLFVHRPSSNVPGTHFCVLSSRGKKCHEQNERRRHLLNAATSTEVIEKPIKFEVQSQRVADTNVGDVGEYNLHLPMKRTSAEKDSPFGLFGPNFVLENEYFDSFLLSHETKYCDRIENSTLVDPYMDQYGHESARMFFGPKNLNSNVPLDIQIDFGVRDEDVEEVFKIIRRNLCQMG